MNKDHYKDLRIYVFPYLKDSGIDFSAFNLFCMMSPNLYGVKIF